MVLSGDSEVDCLLINAALKEVMNTYPGRLNPRVVDTYGLLAKTYMLFSVVRRILEFKIRGGSHLNQFPGTLQIQTRSGCTSNCLLCPQDKISRMFPEETMPRELYNRIAREAAADRRLKGFALVLQNEPLRDEDLFDKIRYFQALNAHNTIVFIVTNAILLTPEKVHQLLDSGLDMMHISVNGYEKEDFEVINRGKSFDIFRANLDYLLQQDLSHLGINMTFIRNSKYLKQMNEAVKYYKSKGLRIHIHGISNRGGLVDSTIMDEYAYAASAESLRNRILKPLARRILPCCPYPFFQCSVLASGQVLMCTHDWSRRSIVGDLKTESIHDVWNGKKLNEIRRLLLSGQRKSVPACSECNVFDELGFV
jgi:radical SAM protein with 4Fe4S-binding SPASM domain